MSICNLDFHITNKCNLRCKHCLYSSGDLEIDEMSFSEITSVIDDFVSITKKRNINFFGGEPLLRKDIFKILDYCSMKEVNTMIITNLHVNRDIIDKIILCKNVTIKVDLDGSSKDSHDWLRNKEGHLEKTIEYIKVLRSAGVKVSITTVLHKNNIHEIDEILNLYKELDINSAMFFYFSPIGRGYSKEMIEIQLDKDTWCMTKAHIKNWIEVNKPSFNIIWEETYLPNNDRPDKICDKMHESLNIMSNGYVYYCGLLASQDMTALGNVKLDKLSTIIERSKEVNNKKYKSCPVLLKVKEQMKSHENESNMPYCPYLCEIL